MSLSPGQRISGYEVVGSIGVGGMGEVYRARDLRLDRDVAIKVLPEAWGEERKHVQRFEREARMLASLNHSNVAHVYGFDEIDGVHILVLELVEGEELADRIGRGPLPLDETVDLCRQIAEGLEAAHDLGVVHRDLKPANVRITPEGVAKVLDFGLAKSLVPKHETGETPSPSPTPNTTFQTEDGLLIGTPTYMSPEQTRGRQVDRRADIWAFGCVVYECLTGTPPFEGETLADTLAAIVKQEPDLTRLPPATPRALYELIARCLVKDPRSRLRDIGEARLVLDRGLDPAPETAAAAQPPPPRKRGRGMALPAVALIAAAAAVAGFLVPRGETSTPLEGDALPPPEPPRRANPLEGAVFSRLTDFEGSEWDAAISRDGNFVSFTSDQGGPVDVWLTQIGSGEFRNVTQGRRKRWSPRVHDAGFLPAASHVWLAKGDDGHVSTIPLLGGELRPFLEKDVINVDWSPDGSRIAYHMDPPGDPVYVANADGSDATQILIHPDRQHQHFATWSHDGAWIYVVRGRPSVLDMDLWRVRPDGTEVERLTFGMKDVAYPTSLDADTVLFVAQASNGAGPWLWELDVTTKGVRRAVEGVEQYVSIAASGDRRRLVATVANPRAQLWTVPIKAEGESGEEDAAPLPGLEAWRAQMPRFGGGRLYFLSSGGSGDGLWCLGGDGKVVAVRRAETAPLLNSPAVSPDGDSLAVLLEREGRLRLHVMAPSGSVRRDVSGDVEVFGAAAWSPDGNWIAIGGEDDEGSGLFLFPADGGPHRRITENTALNPVWSPTEDLIVYTERQQAYMRRVWGVRPSTGEPVEFPPDVGVIRGGERVRFQPDGSGFVFMFGTRRGQDFMRFDLETRRTRRLAELDDRAEVLAFDIDPSGERIVFDRRSKNSDIVLIELAGNGE